MHETQSFLEAVPEELHGHRKKLAFMVRCIEQFQRARGLAAGDVRVLEVGCSHGRNVALPLAERGYRVTGIDLHAESIAHATGLNRFNNARFFCQQLADLSHDERFEVVVLSDILEHVEEPADLCSTAMRFMSSDAILLISIPNGYGPYELEQRFIRKARLGTAIDCTRRTVNRLLRRHVEQPVYNCDSGHIQFFHLGEFQRLLDRVGLKVVARSNGALFGGAVSYALGKIRPIVVASLKLADWLPQRWVSTWYFCCRVRGAPDTR